MSLIDNVIDSIEAPDLTGQPIPQAILHATAIGAYVHGNSWPTYKDYAAARPDLAAKGWIVSISLRVQGLAPGQARCGDFESGGMLNSEVGEFLDLADRVHGLPWLYTFASNTADLTAAAHAQRGAVQGKDFLVWSAHTGHGAHICSPGVCGFPRADGTQYGLAPENCDISQLNDYMLPSSTPTEEPPMALASAKNSAGDLNVVAAKPGGKQLYYTYQKSGQTAWNGGKAGKQVAGLAAFAVCSEPVVGVSMELSAAGSLHVFVEGHSGALYYTYQPKGKASWSGGVAKKQVAGLVPFAPAP